MNLEGVTISHPRHVLYASVYCVELQRRALYWNWKSNNWPRPHLDVSKENVTYENLAPKTIKVVDCLQHTRAESQARAPSPPKSHENAAQKNGHGAAVWRASKSSLCVTGHWKQLTFSTWCRSNKGCWAIPRDPTPFACVFDVTFQSSNYPN